MNLAIYQQVCFSVASHTNYIKIINHKLLCTYILIKRSYTNYSGYNIYSYIGCSYHYYKRCIFTTYAQAMLQGTNIKLQKSVIMHCCQDAEI